MRLHSLQRWHSLVDVVDVGTHGGDHGSQTGGLSQVGDDLSALHTGVVVLVDQQRLDHHQNLTSRTR